MRSAIGMRFVALSSGNGQGRALRFWVAVKGLGCRINEW